jgi:hypothetical protein
MHGNKLTGIVEQSAPTTATSRKMRDMQRRHLANSVAVVIGWLLGSAGWATAEPTTREAISERLRSMKPNQALLVG